MAIIVDPKIAKLRFWTYLGGITATHAFVHLLPAR